MKFEKVFPKGSNEVYYYIDNKKVSSKEYKEKILICNSKKMHYTPSHIQLSDKYVKIIFTMIDNVI